MVRTRTWEGKEEMGQKESVNEWNMERERPKIVMEKRDVERTRGSNGKETELGKEKVRWCSPTVMG